MRLLLLSSWFPFPADNGSKIRVSNLLRGLLKQHDVSVLSFADPTERIEVKMLRDMCRVVGVVPRKSFQPSRARAMAAFLHPSPRSQVDTYSPRFAEQLLAELRETHYDAVVASELGTIEYGLLAPMLPRILDEVQVGAHSESSELTLTAYGHLRRRLTWAKLTRYLRRLLPRYDAVTVASSIEMMRVSSVAPGQRRLRVVPNGVDTIGLRPRSATVRSGSLIYNGALTYSANYDAMRFFTGMIWPHILGAWPTQVNAKEHSPSLCITGSTNGVDLRPIRAPGVIFSGYVDDIASEVQRARVCVVPLRIGGGTRLKILEAMALGTPVVATRKGAEGLEVTHGLNILIADDPKDFAGQVIRLLTDEEYSREIARSARALVETRYEWGLIGQQFCDVVNEVANCRTSNSAA